MGNGLFTAVVFGAIGRLDDGEEGELWYKLLAEAEKMHPGSCFKDMYEGQEEWSGFLVADFGYDIGRWPDPQTADFNRRAFELGSFPDAIARECPEQLARAQLAWESFRKLAADHGMDLPPGTLLLISDWD